MQIIYGEDRRELAKYLRADIAKKDKEKSKARGFFIVPETEKASMERLYFQEDSSRVLLFKEILSFKRFALRIAELSGNKTKNQANRAIELYLLQEVVSSLEEELIETEIDKTKPAYLEKILLFLGELWRYELNSQDLINLADELEAKEENRLAAKLHDFALILKRYEAALRNRNYAPANLQLENLKDELQILISKLEKVDYDYAKLDFPYKNYEFLKDTDIWIYGFGIARSFTSQEYSIVEALEQLCNQVTIAIEADYIPETPLDIDQGKRQFAAGRQLLFDLRQDFKNISYKEIPSAVNLDKYYEFNVFQEKQDETRFVAGTIKQLLFENPELNSEDIAIALASKDQELNMKLALEELNLPFYNQERSELDYALLENFIRALIDVLKYPDDLNYLIYYLKHPYANLSPEEQDLLIDFFLSKGFKAYDVFKVENYETASNKDKLLALKSKSLDSLEDLITASRRQQSISDFSRLIIKFLAREEIETKVLKEKEELIANGKREEAEIEVKSWNNLLKTLNAFLNFASQEKIEIRNYLFYLETGFLSAPTSRIPATGKQIIVGSIEQIARENVDVVFLLGAKQDTIPQKVKENSLVNPLERDKINTLKPRALPDRELQIINGNASDLYGTLALAKKAVYVSYTGALAEEANSFKRFREKLGLKLQSHERPKNILDPRLALATRAYASLKRQVKEEEPINTDEALIAALKSYLSEVNAYTLNLSENNQRQMSRFGTLYLDKDLVRRSLGAKPIWSISRLETYRANPFEFYVKYLLKLETRAKYNIEVSDFGTLVHKILELSQFDWKKSLDQAKDRQARLASLRELINQYSFKQIEEYINSAISENERLELFYIPGQNYELRYKALLAGAQGVRAQIDELLEQRITWVPYASEWDFGRDKAKEFYILDDKGEKIYFQGFIDRVDVEAFPEEGKKPYFRIIDYKTGNKKVDYADLFHGYDLQLPIYLKAFQSLNPSLRPKDAAYAKVSPFSNNSQDAIPSEDIDWLSDFKKEFKLKNLGLDDDVLSYLIEHSLNMAKKIVKKIKSGDFSSRPSMSKDYASKDPSRYCNFRAMAQLDRAPIRTKVDKSLEELAYELDPEGAVASKKYEKNYFELLLRNIYGDVNGKD